MKSLRLNLGSGEKIEKGFVNIDKVRLPGVDKVWDLEKTPLPFKTNSVSEVNCEHILEHIQNFLPLMEELHRICRPGARIQIAAPYYRYEGSFRDPTHVRFFTENTFYYFQNGVRFCHYSKARFKVKDVQLKNHFFSDVKNFHKRIITWIPFKKFLNMFFWNIYSEINYELEVVK
ncbi:MAG: methyltransferase domain-containing protein [Candidatus Woesearchaeota archaeon]